MRKPSVTQSFVFSMRRTGWSLEGTLSCRAWVSLLRIALMVSVIIAGIHVGVGPVSAQDTRERPVVTYDVGGSSLDRDLPFDEPFRLKGTAPAGTEEVVVCARRDFLKRGRYAKRQPRNDRALQMCLRAFAHPSFKTVASVRRQESKTEGHHVALVGYWKREGAASAGADVPFVVDVAPLPGRRLFGESTDLIVLTTSNLSQHVRSPEKIDAFAKAYAPMSIRPAYAEEDFSRILDAVVLAYNVRRGAADLMVAERVEELNAAASAFAEAKKSVAAKKNQIAEALMTAPPSYGVRDARICSAVSVETGKVVATTVRPAAWNASNCTEIIRVRRDSLLAQMMSDDGLEWMQTSGLFRDAARVCRDDACDLGPIRKTSKAYAEAKENREEQRRRLRSALQSYPAVAVHPVHRVRQQMAKGTFVEPVVGFMFGKDVVFAPYIGMNFRIFARNPNAVFHHYTSRQLGISLAAITGGFNNEDAGRRGLIGQFPLSVGLTYHIPFVEFLQIGGGGILYTDVGTNGLSVDENVGMRLYGSVSLQLPTDKLVGALGDIVGL